MAASLQISAPESVVNAATEVLEFHRKTIDLFDRGDYEKSLLKQLMGDPKEKSSQQGALVGKKDHPFDFEATSRLQTSNVHHATCIHAKVNSTVGVGFKKSEGNEEDISKVDTILDPLTDVSFQETLSSAIEDYWTVGNGYLEIVRDAAQKITGIHWLPAKDTYIYVENEAGEYHYEIKTQGSSSSKRFCRFGDKEAFLARIKEGNKAGIVGDVDETAVSEVIHFRRPTSLCRWYGHPDWLAGVASIELTQALHQWKYDFFLNRGVPEFLLFILGQKLDPADWKKVEQSLQAHIGLGNSHKSLALNIANPEIKVQLERLAMDGKIEEEFGGLKENLALDVVSAHRVPPLLAGIQIPGKLGATNELPNALMAFHVLVIGPAQKQIQQVLGKTLGDPNEAKGLGLSGADFVFKKIIDLIDVQAADTMSRMREPVAGSGRDLSQGLKK